MPTAAEPEVDLPGLQPLAAAGRRAQGSGKPVRTRRNLAHLFLYRKKKGGGRQLVPFLTSISTNSVQRRLLTLTSEFCDASFTRGDCFETHTRRDETQGGENGTLEVWQWKRNAAGMRAAGEETNNSHFSPTRLRLLLLSHTLGRNGYEMLAITCGWSN